MLLFSSKNFTMGRKIAIGILFLMFSLAAVAHFVAPEKFVGIMPQSIPHKELLVLITGIAEVVAALLLIIPATQKLGATIILLLLLAYIPVHVNMCFDKDTLGEIPLWGAWLRLVFQYVLIYIACVLRMDKQTTQ